jgi:hypothetical protein
MLATCPGISEESLMTLTPGQDEGDPRGQNEPVGAATVDANQVSML